VEFDDIEKGGNKENDKDNNSKSRKRLSSPTNDIIIKEEQKTEKLKRKTPKRRKLKTPKSPMTPLISKSKVHKSTCDCAEFKIMQFQINFYKFLCAYYNIRCKQLEAMSDLVISRLKEKETTVILTNSDSLQLQTITTERLLCPQFINPANEANLSNNDDLMELLESSFKILEAIDKSPDHINEIITLDKSLQKQLFESVDLLAHIYGLFGYLEKRLKTFENKYKILKTIQASNNNATTCGLNNFDPIFTETCINLMKCYINVHKCDQYETLMGRIFAVPIPNETPIVSVLNNKPSSSGSSSQKKSSASTVTAKLTIDSYVDKVLTAFEEHKLFSAKPETLFVLQIVFTHYLILKHRVS
jgi:hypothetical protein